MRACSPLDFARLENRRSKPLFPFSPYLLAGGQARRRPLRGRFAPATPDFPPNRFRAPIPTIRMRETTVDDA